MKSRSISLLLACVLLAGFTHVASAADEELGEFDELVKRFLRAKFSGEADGFYAEEIILIPGHEYLKAKFRVSEDGDRTKAVAVSKEKMVAIDKAQIGVVPLDRLDDLFDRFQITAVPIEADSEYFLGAEDGGPRPKVRCKAGDVVVVAGIKGSDDIMALVFRRADDKWKVAAELID